jgi:hypothetical protein
MGIDPSTRPGVKKLQARRGELWIWREAPRVFVFKYTGHLTVEMVPFVRETVGTLPPAGGGKVDMFVDLMDVSGYDTDYRVAITEWGKDTTPHVGTFALLLRSKLIAMGVAVSNLAVGGVMRPYTDPKAFDDALKKSVHQMGGVQPTL